MLRRENDSKQSDEFQAINLHEAKAKMMVSTSKLLQKYEQYTKRATFEGQLYL